MRAILTLLSLAGWFGVAWAAPAGEPAFKRTFDLPAGEASTTFKRFIAQSQLQLLYVADEISGVHTNAVKGELALREAIDQLLAGTRLSAVQTANGSIAVRAAPLPNESRAAPALVCGDRPTLPAPATSDEAIELSPFVVTTDWDVG